MQCCLKKGAHFAGGPERVFMQNHPTIRRPVSPRTTQAVLHKQFHQRLSQLSDRDKGRLALSVLAEFFNREKKDG